MCFFIFFLIAGILYRWVDDQFYSEAVVIESARESIVAPPNQDVLVTLIRVHIAGAVVFPGVYDIDVSLRGMDVLAIAGGVLSNADLDKVNLAKQLKDGQRLYVPFKKMRSSIPVSNVEGLKININRASASELVQLPGVGIKTAQLILEYRHKNGLFQSYDELLQIKGIGQKTLAKFQSMIVL